ncbi:malate dehydrogenase, mitochondrial-like [Odontomachus brunneus]|uniref:malate dehydrogenase, mitochondrial-like n=1 Tax=Odontomachus brunneus TaxID=486640 RepID=UPI0013F22277|nr:malate dehydrogenase, mitochondrial-like [Odontomachus brunneus]
MTPLQKYFLKLMRPCRHYTACLHREFSVDNQKDGAKNTKDQNNNQEDNDNNTKSDVKVCIVGGGVTPLYTAVLLKQYRIIKSINLVDMEGSTSAVGAMKDAFHEETNPRINYFGKQNMKQAFKEVDIVALMDETDAMTDSNNLAPRKQFQLSVDYVRQMADQMLRFCPGALVAVFARPVTATLAMISEIFKSSGCSNPDRIIGSAAAYKARVEETAATLLNFERVSLSVPIVGGADESTVVPLLSRAVPFNQFTNAQRQSLLQSFRTDENGEITKTFFRYRSSLSSGTAAMSLLTALAGGLCGYDNIITCAYMRSDVLPVCRFFTSELQLGVNGVKRNLGLPKISPAEILLIEQAIPLINEYVDMAFAAVRTKRIQQKGSARNILQICLIDLQVLLSSNKIIHRCLYMKNNYF